jgi:hypothetical protein
MKSLIKLNPEQLAYLKSLDSKKKKRKFLLDCFVENIEVEIESKELIEKSNEEPQLLDAVCVKINSSNRDILQKVYNEYFSNYFREKSDSVLNCEYLISNTPKTNFIQTDDLKVYVKGGEPKIVTTDEFLKYIGREDLIEKESKSDYQKRIIQEAIKKGFCKGVEFKSVEPNCFNESIITFGNINDTFEFDGLDMYNSKGWILKNGIWAEIIKSPKYSPEEIELVKHNINQREVSEQGSELLKFDMLGKSKKQKTYKYPSYSKVELTPKKINKIIIKFVE